LLLTDHSETKRSAEPEAEVNWKGVAYDLKDVDWSTVSYTAGFGGAAPAATPAQEQKQPVVAAAATPVVEAKKEKPTSAIVVATSTKAAQSSQAATPSSNTPSSGGLLGNLVGNLVSDVSNGVQSLADELKCKVGKNKHSKNEGAAIWIGSDGEWGMDVTNAGSQYAIWYCWHFQGYTDWPVGSALLC
jgi:hypothetical protein